ncbi:hypothetical protein EYF80_028585 [Liparis tanakae]|uniref:Uncharacterized protein n=1 Tax=Liparis tanakae TaxID=230148 RepID=A0A4Z2H6R6_9TELE|nr:hypothetical protein EYF80_028585 [Liparis tanakae]
MTLTGCRSRFSCERENRVSLGGAIGGMVTDRCSGRFTKKKKRAYREIDFEPSQKWFGHSNEHGAVAGGLQYVHGVVEAGAL